jgi:hypothetical protein
MAKNEKFSHKSFLQQTLTDTDPKDWNDTDVVGSCFYNEKPRTKVFPDGIKNVKFIGCNLDNIVIPETCAMEKCTNKLIQVQSDLNDWILDEDLKPVEPLDKARYIKLGVSYDPKDLPVAKAAENVLETKLRQLEEQLEADKAAATADLDAAATWR